ncbi:MAG: hypothetical protein KQJ78_20560 [Deltaproteobacteria bacterium]|nr:hypothetical protein [Deltaproteobacteria bacterium]
MTFTDDLTLFFADFAVTVTADPGGAGERTFRAIFDEDAYRAQGLVDVSTTQPALTLAPADAAGLRGKTVRVPTDAGLGVQGGDYRVADLQPDGSGLYLALLREA